MAFIDTTELDELRRKMLSFARSQLNDDPLAEDTVQEALAGAFKNADSFKRSAHFKTWVFAILKNKISDALRQRYRQPESESFDDDCKDCGSANDQYFNSDGHWQDEHRPQRWGAADNLVHNEQFWRVFDTCLEILPADQARAFMMREFVELSSAEICETLELSTSNLHVLLHRARLRLRDCLAKHW